MTDIGCPSCGRYMGPGHSCYTPNSDPPPSQWPVAQPAPGHTDLMVTPESLDDYMEKNPLPAPKVESVPSAEELIAKLKRIYLERFNSDKCDAYWEREPGFYPPERLMVPVVEDFMAAIRYESEAQIVYEQERNRNNVAMYSERLQSLETLAQEMAEALEKIAEPDQEPLRTALRTNDEIRIIEAVTRALNWCRDTAKAALEAWERRQRPESGGKG